MIKRPELIKTAKKEQIQQSTHGHDVADGNQGSAGGASRRGDTALLHCRRRFLSSGPEAEKKLKESPADGAIDQKREKEIKYVNSRTG